MRKEKKYHFIYKTTNTLSGRYYIGMHSTNNLDGGYLGSGNRLRRAINKYGKEHFVREILEYCETREKLVNRESEIVTLNEIAKEDCMNLVVGGTGGFISLNGCTKGGLKGGSVHRERMKNDAEYKEKFTKIISKVVKECKEEGKYSKPSFKGKTHSEETKAKMRKTKNKGKSNSQYGSMWITNEKENRKVNKGSDIPAGWRRGRVINKIKN